MEAIKDKKWKKKRWEAKNQRKRRKRERSKKGEEPSKEEENKKWGKTRGKEIEVGNSVTRKGTREKKNVPVLTKMGL